MNEELFFIRLRDCFTAGYTFPQFCIDNNIKKPLFVALDERHVTFLWEIHIQFKYDKRITPDFSLLNGKSGAAGWSVGGMIAALKFENISSVNLSEYDKIIFLIAGRLSQNIPNAIYLNQLTNYFISRAYLEIPVLHFMQRHPKVKLIVTNFPQQPQIDDEEFNKYLYDFSLPKIISQNPNVHVKNHFDKLGYTNEEVRNLILGPRRITNLDGSTSMEDNPHPLVRVEKNQRLTAYQPEKFVNKIYFVGSCNQYGVNAPFDKTIESYLQKMLNNNNFPYRVENESRHYFNRYQDFFYNLIKLDPKPGDIIFVAVNDILPITQGIPFIDVSKAFDGYDPKDLWVLKAHANEKGYKILAEFYFDVLVKNNFLKNIEIKYPAPPPPPRRFGIPKENSSPANTLFDFEELEAHKQKLREKRLKIGCLTINANPFHLGHEYLVQYAASRVHKLFILVDQEDKTDFSFTDRFELVKRGTAQFPNVEVLPSSKFFASMQTFSGYFNKESLQDVYVDSTDNAEMFAAEIAPSLGVTIKFDGEEPRDNVTRQYHDNLRTLLPRYGIEYCEIPRKEINGEVISAKTVRAALKVGDFEKISKLVPKTTLEFLRQNYNKNVAPPPPLTE